MNINFKYIVLIILVIIITRNHNNLLVNEFYGEDGNLFFENAASMSFGSLFESYNSYMHTISRLIALFFSNFPLKLQPFLYSLSATIITFLVAVSILNNQNSKIYSNQERYIWAFLFCLIPWSEEVQGNMINIQWFLQIYLLNYLFSDQKSKSKIVFFEYFLIFLISISGPFSLLMLPIIGCIIIKEKSIKIKHIIIVLGGIIQIYSLFNTPNTIKTIITLDFIINLLGYKLVWYQLLGKNVSGYFFNIFGYNYFFNAVSLIIFSYIIYYILEKKNFYFNMVLLYSALILVSGIVRLAPFNRIDNDFYSCYYVTLFYFISGILVSDYIANRNWILLFYVIPLLFIAIPFDFKDNKKINLEWSNIELLTNNIDKNQYVTLPSNPYPFFTMKVRGRENFNIINDFNESEIINKLFYTQCIFDEEKVVDSYTIKSGWIDFSEYNYNIDSYIYFKNNQFISSKCEVTHRGDLVAAKKKNQYVDNGFKLVLPPNSILKYILLKCSDGSEKFIKI